MKKIIIAVLLIVGFVNTAYAKVFELPNTKNTITVDGKEMVYNAEGKVKWTCPLVDEFTKADEFEGEFSVQVYSCGSSSVAVKTFASIDDKAVLTLDNGTKEKEVIFKRSGNVWTWMGIE